MAAPLPSSPASVARLACASSCGTAGTVRPGSLLRVRGKTLSKADEVVFLGAEGLEDDVTAATTVRRKTSVDVRVPLGAAPGPVAIVDSNGAVSAPSVGPVALDPAAPAVAPPSIEVAIRAPRAYYDAVTPAAATYVVHGAAPVTVGVDVVRELDGVVLAHWDVPAVAPEVAQRLAWDGTVAGAVQPDGKYAFRLTVAGLAPASAPFEFFSDRYPDSRAVAVRHRAWRSAAGATTRARTRSRPAGPRWWPRTAARSSTRATTRPRATTW